MALLGNRHLEWSRKSGKPTHQEESLRWTVWKGQSVRAWVPCLCFPKNPEAQGMRWIRETDSWLSGFPTKGCDGRGGTLTLIPVMLFCSCSNLFWFIRFPSCWFRKPPGCSDSRANQYTWADTLNQAVSSFLFSTPPTYRHTYSTSSCFTVVLTLSSGLPWLFEMSNHGFDSWETSIFG